jgi:chitodextrinase
MTTDIDGLTPDTNYTFALTATNGAAESVNSSEVTIATPAIEPFAPSMPRNLRGGSIGPTWVKLAWDPPLRRTNLANYIVAFESPPGLNSTITTNETCVNITGLQPETTYTCSCTPVTSNGTRGEPSFVTGTTSTAGLSMPMNVVATATNATTIRVQWMHPDFARTIDHYFVSWQPSVPSGVTLAGGMMEINCTSANTPVMGTTNCTDVMEFNITGLEEYVIYTMMVIASNDVGNSTSGTATARTLPAIPDGVVSMINATPTYNSVVLQWDAIPYLTRNGPNVTYIVTITQTGTSDVIALLTVATLSVTRTGLTPLTMYDVTVRAANDEGNAAVVSSVQQFTTLEQPPAAVTGITVAPDDSGTTANISWTPPSGNITMYSIRITDSSGNVIVTGSATNSSFMANELSPFILYTVTVTPSTSGGAGSSASHMFYTRQDGEFTCVRKENVQSGTFPSTIN